MLTPILAAALLAAGAAQVPPADEVQALGWWKITP